MHLAASTAMWFAMMSAMMLPPSLPWLRTYAVLSAPRGAAAPGARAGAGALAPFVGGYLAVWLGFSMAAAAVQLGLGGAGLLQAGGAMLEQRMGATLLIAAGLYQLTPLKASCLRHCRNPLTYFLASWRNGPAGAVRMGLAHGLFCLGCCWALMALALALGVMSLGWMAALAAVVLVENVAPHGPVIGRWLGGVLVVWGVLALASS